MRIQDNKKQMKCIPFRGLSSSGLASEIDGDCDWDVEEPSGPKPDAEVDESMGLAAETDACVKLGDDEAGSFVIDCDARGTIACCDPLGCPTTVPGAGWEAEVEFGCDGDAADTVVELVEEPPTAAAAAVA